MCHKKCHKMCHKNWPTMYETGFGDPKWVPATRLAFLDTLEWVAHRKQITDKIYLSLEKRLKIANVMKQQTYS